MTFPRNIENINLEPKFIIPRIEIPKMCEHKVLVLKKNNENIFFNFNEKTYKCLECNHIFYITTNNIKMIKH